MGGMGLRRPVERRVDLDPLPAHFSDQVGAEHGVGLGHHGAEAGVALGVDVHQLGDRLGDVLLGGHWSTPDGSRNGQSSCGRIPTRIMAGVPSSTPSGASISTCTAWPPERTTLRTAAPSGPG